MIAGRRFLVVEDEYFIAATIQRAIERAGGVVVTIAGSAEEGCEAAERADFDGAVLDWNLDGKSGELVAQILARKGIPFVIATGYGAVKAPFDDRPLIAKPYTAAMLVGALGKLF